MKSTFTARLVIVLLLVLAGLTVTFALEDDNPGLVDGLPAEVLSTMKEGSGILYAHAPSSQILYISYTGDGWHQVTAPPVPSIVSIASTVDRRELIVASEEAIYVSDDGTREWDRIHLPVASNPVALAAASRPKGGVYIALEDNSILHVRVEDGVVALLEPAGLQGNASDLMVHPAGYLLAGTAEGLFRRDVDARTWERLKDIPPVERLFRSSSAKHLFAVTTNDGLFRSTDGGATWQPGNAGLVRTGSGLPVITTLVEKPGAPDAFFAATASRLADGRLYAEGIYFSSDGGETWIRVAKLSNNHPPIPLLLPESRPLIETRAVVGNEVQSYRLEPDQALALLNSADAGQRLDGAKLFSIVAQPVHERALLARLRDGNPEIVYYAGRALGRIGNDRAWSILLDSLKDQEMSPLRRALLTTVEARGAEAVPRLLPLLADGNPTVRANVAEALGASGQKMVSSRLRPLLADPQAEVRARAAIALGMLGDQDSGGTLQRLEQADPAPEVRAAAEQALMEMDEVAASDPSSQVTLASAELEGTPFGLLKRSKKAWIKALILSVIAAASTVILAARPGSSRIKRKKR